MIAEIAIKNLRLRTIIGLNPSEREKKQDIIINIKMKFDATQAISSDDINNSINYKAIKKEVITHVESSSYQLLETLASSIIDIMMHHQSITFSYVEIDKPHALRFADSVSVSMIAERD